MSKLWIDQVDCYDLVREHQVGNRDRDQVEDIVMAWIGERCLAAGGIDDSFPEFISHTFEAGWIAARAGLDHVTICEVSGGDSLIVAGSSEKLVRDLSEYIKLVDIDHDPECDCSKCGGNWD